VFARDIGDLRDGRDLWHPRPRDDAGGTDRPRADADLEAVREVDEVLSRLAGADVSNDDVRVDGLLDVSSALDDVQVVRVRGVDEEDIGIGLVGGRRTVVLERANGDATAEATVLVADGLLVLAALEDAPCIVTRPTRRFSSSTTGTRSIL